MSGPAHLLLCSLYTGAHKHRFDTGGYGRGKEGRTSANAYVSAYDLTARR